MNRLTEILRTDPPSLVLAEWAADFPWLVQGTTTRGSAGREFDLGLFSGGSAGRPVFENWEALRAATRADRAVHARQLHEATVRSHSERTPGLFLAEPCDGHATAEPGVLLTVATADCVPAFLVSPDPRAVAVVHAGWRGAAAGVLESGIRALADGHSADPAAMHLHLGPSICGECYEVGPEVFEALGLAAPSGPTPIDLRAALADRAERAGLAPGNVSVSAHCTRCTGSDLYSHRGGDAGRQVGYIGIRC